MLQKLNAYLRLLRIHTASLTFPAVLLGAIIGGETNLFRLFNFLCWAILFHGVGFTANSVLDIKYDRADPHKKHFPLVTGEISLESAKLFVFVGTILGFNWGILLSHLSPFSILFLVLAIVFGWAYNLISKKTVLGTLFIMGSTVSLPLFSYFSVADALNPLIIMVCIYMLSYMAYDIGYLGYFKDLPSDKVNLLKLLGSTFKNNVYTPSKLAKLMVVVRLFTVCFAIVIEFYVGLEPFSGFLMLGAITLEVNFLAQVHKQVDFSGSQLKITRLCGIIEVLGYLVLIFALGNYLQLWGTVLFVLGPVLYYICLNKLTWKTIIAPKV